ncbi:metallopeptidase family protein [Promicromonospora iranensis]|uniref:Zn-dependent protease with MMP-like domain n=1 Tax=Promicromonospora iranensis TaxID=1105144 RepID=A0ABU2CRU6_9MICO|nr:metallopeptidase family protein [Promicromonospora iranensis]MDR7384066.1 putative Zn-dependent protease with MMP-like domain [Promicromonospora iranensis]
MPPFSPRGRNRRSDRNAGPAGSSAGSPSSGTPGGPVGPTGIPKASQADLLRLAASRPGSSGGQPGDASGEAVRPRRRDRRGRGLRGPMFPPGTPAHRTRAQRFDDLVLDVVEDLDRTWAAQLRGTEFAVEDVPPSDPAPWEDGGVLLGRFFPAEAGRPGRVVVYRRPVEVRAFDREDLADLVRDVVVEQVAHMLARTPEEIDPHFGDRS